jgi:hypothetical protein
VESMSHDLTAFIAACAQRDTEAVAAFQDTYGVLIYTFPMRVFHLPEDKAGDFYLYAFDTGRIFARLRSFEGRNAARFETYLSGYVLRDLCLEWLRTTEHVELISLDAPVDGGATDSTRVRTVQEVLVAPEPPPEATLGASDDLQVTQRGSYSKCWPSVRWNWTVMTSDVWRTWLDAVSGRLCSCWKTSRLRSLRKR